MLHQEKETHERSWASGVNETNSFIGNATLDAEMFLGKPAMTAHSHLFSFNPFPITFFGRLSICFRIGAEECLSIARRCEL